MITIATVVIAAIAVLLLPRSVRIVPQGLVGVVNLAEDGRGQAQILRAEGQKQAAILEAEGREGGAVLHRPDRPFAMTTG